MRIRARQEDGVALIVALMVTFVVLLLSTVVISQAIHGTDQSAYNRQRLTSVNAAEAGLDNYFNYLEVTPVVDLSTAPVIQTLGSSGGTIEFTTTPTFYDDELGEDPFSGTPSASNYPKSALLVSVGTTNDGTERTMESFVLLEPIYGGLTGAVVTNSSTTFSNNFTINGNDGNDADVYVLNGNFTVPSGLQTIHGDIWVHGGTALIGTGLHVYGEVWANGSVTVNHPSALVDLAAKSTTSSVTVTTGTVTGDAYYCTGSAPGANVQGQKIQTCALGPPPTTVFPQIPYTPSTWTDQGYYINPTYTGASACTNARDYIEGTGAGTFNGGAGVPSGYDGAVVYIDATCTFTTTNNATISLGKNLAVITTGSIDLSQRSTWNGVTSTKNLYFMSPYPATLNCTTSPQAITLGNNTSFNSLVNTFIYSPCTVTMNNNNSAFQGQVIGGTVSVGNLFTMSYRPILVPGAEVVGFEQDIAYIREVS